VSATGDQDTKYGDGCHADAGDEGGVQIPPGDEGLVAAHINGSPGQGSPAMVASPDSRSALDESFDGYLVVSVKSKMGLS